MVVYRIENSMGTGPYMSSTDPVGETLGMADAEYAPIWLYEYGRHPSPAEDLPNICVQNKSKPYNLHFGFQSKTQLKEWFGGAEGFLNHRGYKINTYLAADAYVLKGEKQIAFDITKAMPFTSHTLH